MSARRRAPAAAGLVAATCLLLLAPPPSHAGRDGLPGATRPAFVQTSAAGDRLRARTAPTLLPGASAADAVLTVDLAAPRQTIEGIGGSLTESSAWVLAHLPLATRERLLDAFFGPRGLDLTMARTPIGSCDFTVAGRWSYDDVPGDTALVHFSLAPDRAGSASAVDPAYALLPLIHDAFRRQPGLKLVASPWSAPGWMKDNGEPYTKGVRGGHLRPEHRATFARYTARYVSELAGEGVRVWGVTPVNEPLGVSGQWESMEMGPEELRDYLRDHLGPALAGTGVRILQYDQNRDEQALRYTRAVFADSACARFVWGTAVHGYAATNSARGDILDALAALAPGRPIVHTEGCIDALSTTTNSSEAGFFGWREDGWWWREQATDWGWDWAPPEDKHWHPRYAPVHRYARDLVDGLAHGLAGWIDWNIVLDERGGPNHAGNRCAAPVMIDVQSGTVYQTPLYPIIGHVSRYVRPGDQVVGSTLAAPGLAADDLHAVAVRSADGRSLVVVLFNKAARALTYDVRVGGRHAAARIPANAVQTLRLALPRAD